MTMRLPKPGLLDHVLKVLGKRRGVVVPQGIDPSAPYGQFLLRWESFWSVLVRPTKSPFPEGVFDTEDLLGGTADEMCSDSDDTRE